MLLYNNILLSILQTTYIVASAQSDIGNLAAGMTDLFFCSWNWCSRRLWRYANGVL